MGARRRMPPDRRVGHTRPQPGRRGCSVPPLQLRRIDFTSRLMAVVERHGVAPRRLVLEITESAAMEEPERTKPAPARVPATRLPRGDRRLRRPALLARPLERARRRRAEDRPSLPRRRAPALGGVRDLRRDDRAGGRARDDRSRRGHRDRRAVPLPRRPRLPFGQGFGIARPMPADMATAHLTRARELAR